MFLKQAKNPLKLAGDTIAIGGDGTDIPHILELETGVLPGLPAVDTDGRTIILSNLKATRYLVKEVVDGIERLTEYTIKLDIRREPRTDTEAAEVLAVKEERDKAKAEKAKKTADAEALKAKMNFEQGLSAAARIAEERAKAQRILDQMNALQREVEKYRSN